MHCEPLHKYWLFVRPSSLHLQRHQCKKAWVHQRLLFCVWKLKVDFKGLLKELQGLLCGRNNNLSYQGQGLTEGQRCLFILLARSRNESDSVIFRRASRAVEGVYSPPGVPLEAPGRGQLRAFACAWGLSCRCWRQLPRYKLTQRSHQISILSKWGTDHGRLP